MNLLLVLAAFLLSVSGLLFDSYWVKVSALSYPIIFLSLGFITVMFLIFLFKNQKLSKNSVYFVFFMFLSFFVVSVFSSIISGSGDLFALGMKTLTIVVNFLFFISGYMLVKHRKKIFFARPFFYFSLIFSAFLSIFFAEKFNNNWLGITLVFSVLVLMLSENRDRQNYFAFLFFFVSIYSFFVLSSRGAAIASFLAALYIFLIKFSFKRLYSLVNGFVVVSLIFSSILVSIFGVYLYNSDIYPYLIGLSLESTGKSLDSSRLERWDLGAKLFLERPVIGWGLDSHIVRVSNSNEFGDLHNFWWEMLFRGGVVGALCFLLTFVFVAYKKIRNKSKAEDVVAFLIIFIFMSVYALGGVTHWPGSYMFWLVLGMLLGNGELEGKGSRASGYVKSYI